MIYTNYSNEIHVNSGITRSIKIIGVLWIGLGLSEKGNIEFKVYEFYRK